MLTGTSTAHLYTSQEPQTTDHLTDTLTLLHKFLATIAYALSLLALLAFPVVLAFAVCLLPDIYILPLAHMLLRTYELTLDMPLLLLATLTVPAIG